MCAASGDGAASEYRHAFEQLVKDPRYQKNLDWGEPRQGHPEGSIRAHIADLEHNLDKLHDRLSDADYWKLMLLIHVHDTFKGVAEPEAAIAHPHSHASLARAFLAEYCPDADLLAMVQNHDVPYALYRQYAHRHRFDRERFERLIRAIGDWNVFAAFLLIDGGTEGKSPAPLEWFLPRIAKRVETQFSAKDILNAREK